ncbi:LexA family transcriptional regulator [Peptostreptococcus faecalis]|uniref:LexA family transcriptional regulator n=1 Tax=Peptostreptococcus faecalis TaxID=2045015 RepID=UPI000C7C5917|nr:XRE family transcriptional regulator [Peptostreptococcus faecalis]
MNKDLFISRMKESLKDSSMSQYSLSMLTGINKGSISSYMSGKYLPKQDKIIKFAEVLNVNPEWLMCHSDNKFIDVYDPNSPNLNQNTYRYIDNSVSAGVPDNIDGYDFADQIEIPNLFLGKYANRKDILIMKVNGDSMNKVIPDKSFIAIITEINMHSIRDGDIVVFSDEYNYSVKKFFNNKKEKKYIFVPESYDSSFREITFDYDNTDNLKIIGKVIMFCSKF